MPGQRLHLLELIGYAFSTHLFGLSTKFGHSIPRPLDLDGHSVKRPFEDLQVSSIIVVICITIIGLWQLDFPTHLLDPYLTSNQLDSATRKPIGDYAAMHV